MLCAQFGRKPGLSRNPPPALMPAGNPYASYVVPLLDQVQRAIDRVGARKRRQVHSVAGDLGINDATVRQTMSGAFSPSASDSRLIPSRRPKRSGASTDAGLTQKRTPAQVQIACACGYSARWWSHIASLLARGAGQPKGLAGAVVQDDRWPTTTLARLPYQRLSKRAKLRRLAPNPLENQEGKN